MNSTFRLALTVPLLATTALLSACAGDKATPLSSQLFAHVSLEGLGLPSALTAVRAQYTSTHLQAADAATGDVFGAAVALSRDGNTPTGVPERTASIWTAWRFLPQWQAGFGARYVGERQGNTANTTKLPSYVVLDASLAYDYSRNLKLGLAVKNLADRDYALAGTATARWNTVVDRITAAPKPGALPTDAQVLFLVSGGASSLVDWLVPGASLADLQALNRWALQSGTAIAQVNATLAARSGKHRCAAKTTLSIRWGVWARWKMSPRWLPGCCRGMPGLSPGRNSSSMAA